MNKIFEKESNKSCNHVYIEAVKNREGYRNCRTVNESTSAELGDWCRQVVLLIYTFVIVLLLFYFSRCFDLIYFYFFTFFFLPSVGQGNNNRHRKKSIPPRAHHHRYARTCYICAFILFYFILSRNEIKQRDTHLGEMSKCQSAHE